MASLNKKLIERLYEAASIQRWNDHVRPVEFTELDKQAHKMMIAFVLARYDYDFSGDDDFSWLRLIEGSIFEFLHRVVLTDIKPPVFHRMMHEKGKELNEFVLQKLKVEIDCVSGDFSKRFEKYLFDKNYARKEKRILKAAHYMATQWEFNIIYKTCPWVYGIENTKAEIENQLEDYYDLQGVQKISLGRKSFGFISLCGQLRFQRRWSQSPRLPETSVLGHMLIVAYMTYFALSDVGVCEHRMINGFIGGLFHDLPEVLTRDITTPIKTAVEGLDAIISQYEKKQIEERLLPLLPKPWHDELLYLIENEFANKVMIDGALQSGFSIEELNENYNENRFKAVDGVVIRACDHLAAYVEVILSLQHGVTSRHLRGGRKRLQEKCGQLTIANIDIGAIIAEFDQSCKDLSR